MIQYPFQKSHIYLFLTGCCWTISDPVLHLGKCFHTWMDGNEYFITEWLPELSENIIKFEFYFIISFVLVHLSHLI